MTGEKDLEKYNEYQLEKQIKYYRKNDEILIKKERYKL